MKNTITEMKNILERIKIRLNKEYDWFRTLGDKVKETTYLEKQKENLNEDSIRDLWDIIKQKEKRETKELKTYLKK